MCKQRKRPDGPLKKICGIWCRYYGKKVDVCSRPEVITKRRHVSVPSWGLAANVSPELYKKALGHSSHIYRERDNARRSRGRGGTAESRGNHQQRGHRRRATHSQRGGERRARREDEEKRKRQEDHWLPQLHDVTQRAFISRCSNRRLTTLVIQRRFSKRIGGDFDDCPVKHLESERVEH